MVVVRTAHPTKSGKKGGKKAVKKVHHSLSMYIYARISNAIG